MLLKLYLLLVVSSILLQSATPVEFFNMDECGKSRACWAYPPDCKLKECLMVARWYFQANKLNVELQAKDVTSSEEMGQWMALGFSDDQSMGNDTVFECVFDPAGAGSEAYISYNEFTNNVQLLDASQKMLKNKAFKFTNDRMLCAFQVDFNQQNNAAEAEKNSILKLDGGDWWHVIFAQGLADPNTGQKAIHSVVVKSDQLVKVCEKCDKEDKFVVIVK